MQRMRTRLDGNGVDAISALPAFWHAGRLDDNDFVSLPDGVQPDGVHPDGSQLDEKR